jgi:hypothetical protein
MTGVALLCVPVTALGALAVLADQVAAALVGAGIAAVCVAALGYGMNLLDREGKTK